MVGAVVPAGSQKEKKPLNRCQPVLDYTWCGHNGCAYRLIP